jgi:hypothetical protein
MPAEGRAGTTWWLMTRGTSWCGERGKRETEGEGGMKEMEMWGRWFYSVIGSGGDG